MRYPACGSGSSIDAAQENLAHLAEVFARVRDEIVALHGKPFLEIDQPEWCGDYHTLTAGWALRAVNYGFRIRRHAPDDIEIITWADEGVLSSAKVRLRSHEHAERMLRQVLPPVLLNPSTADTTTKGTDYA